MPSDMAADEAFDVADERHFGDCVMPEDLSEEDKVKIIMEAIDRSNGAIIVNYQAVRKDIERCLREAIQKPRGKQRKR